jgi:hypothetical protein
MGTVGKLMSRRGTVPVVPGADLSSIEKLDLIDIVLLTDIDGSPREVPHLGLRFDAGGMAVRSAEGAPVVQIPWVSLRGLNASVRTVKGGPARTELTVESDRRTHRFVVPNVDPEALRGSLRAMSGRYASDGLLDSGAKKGFRIR